MLTRTGAAIIAALLALPLGACTPEGPQASATETPCHTLARVAMDDYAATPATRELALELLRVRCLGMTADGSRQLRPGAPVARNSNVNRNPASAPDDLSMFQQDMRAVPPQ
jgi:hypothetical protein